MCTGLSFRNGNSHYFGRNLDLEIDYPISVTIAPRNYEYKFRHLDTTYKNHYAMIGMGMVVEGYPLMFEAINEKGLGIAGLAFWNSCHYFEPIEGKTNVASFELIPYIMADCATVEDARKKFENMNITNEGFSVHMPPSPLHWIIGDDKETIVVEQTIDGLKVYDDPYDVLTNEPTFPFHKENLNYYCNVCNHIKDFKESRFAPNMPDFRNFGAGTGSANLPGGLDPVSRFVRVAFYTLNSRCKDTENTNISQFFHILQSVAQPDGGDNNKPGEYEITQYTCGCNTKTLRFYYTTYNNQSLNAVDLMKEDLEADQCKMIPVIRDLQVNVQN